MLLVRHAVPTESIGVGNAAPAAPLSRPCTRKLVLCLAENQPNTKRLDRGHPAQSAKIDLRP